MATWPGLGTGVERWEVEVVIRWPGPYALEQAGGAGEGDVARSTAFVWRGGRVVVVVIRWR